MVRAAAGLAIGVDAIVLAEGIETHRQQTVMVDLGVTPGQGYGLDITSAPSSPGLPMAPPDALTVARASA